MPLSNATFPSWWNREPGNQDVFPTSANTINSDSTSDVDDAALIDSPQPELTKTPFRSRPPLYRLRTSSFHLRRLISQRRSREMLLAVAKSPASAVSAYVSGSSNRTSSIMSPITPRLFPYATSRETAVIAQNSEKTPPISFSELKQTWTHAVDLADANWNQDARLLFTLLFSRKGVPAHIYPLLPLNAGILTLKEEAPLSALHTFHVTVENLSFSGSLKALANFLMGVAAWDIAASAIPGYVATPLPQTDLESVQMHSQITTLGVCSGDSLGKAREFFGMCLEEMNDADALDYAALGLNWCLERRIVEKNIISCDRALTLRAMGDKEWVLTGTTVYRLPERMLFIPPAFAAVTSMETFRDSGEMNVERQHDQGRASSEGVNDGYRARSMRLMDSRLMKELPPLPNKEVRYC